VTPLSAVPPVITIVNPDTTLALSKTITASTNAGTLSMFVNPAGVTTCGSSLAFVPYSSITFSSEADNTKTVCYKAEVNASNLTYALSNPIAGIDTTPPVGGLLTAMTINHPAPGIIITSPTAGMYALTPALRRYDVFTSLSVVVTDNNLNTANVPVFIDGSGSANGNMVYDVVGGVWNYVPGTPVAFTEGTHDISATFRDNATNTTILTVSFMSDQTNPRIDTIPDQTYTEGDILIIGGF